MNLQNFKHIKKILISIKKHESCQWEYINWRKGNLWRSKQIIRRRKYIHKLGGAAVIRKEGSSGGTQRRRRWEDVAQTIAVGRALLLRCKQGGELKHGSCICRYGHSWNMIKFPSSPPFSIHVWEEKILMGPTYFVSLYTLSFHKSSLN